jgi:TonB-dependent SusC/RagA subfamily outer membrane receptor
MKNNLKIEIVNRDTCLFKRITTLIVLVFCTSFAVFGQTQPPESVGKKMVGLVRDAHTKQPIQAAEITIPALNLSAISDETGRFYLSQVTSGMSVLRIKAFDYNVREIAIQDADSVVVDLYSNAFQSYFKPVNTTTGMVENSLLPVSYKSLTDLDFNNAFSVDEIFQSEFGADLRSINRSGVTGQGASIFIRGVHSLNANAQPLYIVDGVIWHNMFEATSIHDGFQFNPLDNIEVSDIESVTVMKDGTSIYGSKASNGVVLINTKRAKSMVTQINLRVLHGVVERPDVLPMMANEQFRTYASDMLGSMGMSGSDVSSLGFLQTDETNPIYNTYHNKTNWADLVYRNAVHKSYNINAQGGDDAAMYYFSLGYTGNDEVVKEKSFQRINTRFNADLSLAERLKLGINIGFNRNERQLTDDGINNFTSPTWLSMIKAPFLSPYKFTLAGQRSQNLAFADEFGISNPLGVIDYSVNEQKKYRLNIGVLPTWLVAPGLKLSTQFDYSEEKNVESHFDPFLFVPERMLPGFGITYNNTISQQIRQTSFYDDTRLTYERNLNKLHRIKAIWGWRYTSSYFESDYLEEHNSKSNTKTTITGKYQYLQTNGANNLSRSIGNYVTGEYVFDNRVFINGALSVDGSSRFGTQTDGGLQMFGHSWGFFPSINAGWLMSSAGFMKKFKLGYIFKASSRLWVNW